MEFYKNNLSIIARMRREIVATSFLSHQSFIKCGFFQTNFYIPQLFKIFIDSETEENNEKRSVS